MAETPEEETPRDEEEETPAAEELLSKTEELPVPEPVLTNTGPIERKTKTLKVRKIKTDGARRSART